MFKNIWVVSRLQATVMFRIYGDLLIKRKPLVMCDVIIQFFRQTQMHKRLKYFR